MALQCIGQRLAAQDRDSIAALHRIGTVHRAAQYNAAQHSAAQHSTALDTTDGNQTDFSMPNWECCGTAQRRVVVRVHFGCSWGSLNWGAVGVRSGRGAVGVEELTEEGLPATPAALQV